VQKWATLSQSAEELVQDGTSSAQEI